MTYKAECQPIKKQQMHKMDIAEMIMLRQMYGKTKNDKIKNEHFRALLGVTTVDDKIRETRLRWFNQACPMQAGNGASKEKFGYEG